MNRLKQAFAGGSAANEQLTAIVAAVLILLLAIEGATLLQLGSLLTVHAFVGMLLIPIVALKLGSTGWRMLRYYRGGEEYVRRGSCTCWSFRACYEPGSPALPDASVSSWLRLRRARFSRPSRCRKPTGSRTARPHTSASTRARRHARRAARAHLRCVRGAGRRRASRS